MPPPVDVGGVRRLLSMVQYLNKFLPSRSDMTKPLQDPTTKEALWVWEHQQQEDLEALKQAVANTPVLRYYSLSEEVALQCDVACAQHSCKEVSH